MFRSVLLGLAAGAGAGIVGAVWTSRMLEEYANQLLAAQNIPQVSITEPTPIPGTYEEALSRVRDRVKARIAAFVPRSTDSGTPSMWLSQDDVIAYGALVSNDGWIAVDASAFADVKNPAAALDVWIDGVRYGITSLVHDDRSTVVMARVSGANFSSMDFAATNGVQSGTMMFAVAPNSVVPMSVVSSDAQIVSGVLPAETFATTWMLSQASTISEPIVNAAGNLAGFTRRGEFTALPMHNALHAVKDVVKSGSISLPALGAYTVDLSRTFAVPETSRQGLFSGALVVAPNALTHAVVDSGPAAQAGIALGDVILAVDGENITATTTLAELLSTYEPGSVTRLTVYRGGETLTVSVTLGDEVSVIY